MGSCFSSSVSTPASPTAKVVSINGDLREYTPPVSVSQVLIEASDSSSDYFLCNSDLLSYDEPVPALASDVFLIPNQLYFLLPISKLNSRLTAPDMAALAVRASQAIQTSNRGRKKSSISPVLFIDDRDHDSDMAALLMLPSQKPKAEPALQPSGGQFRRSRSIRKLHRYASRRAKLAVRSFRLGLATIYEGTAV
ncbi:hypothetical protein LINPERPRIM_LOCUS18765 [Linum perenne]